jgi:hypothetical protein
MSPFERIVCIFDHPEKISYLPAFRQKLKLKIICNTTNHSLTFEIQ